MKPFWDLSTSLFSNTGAKIKLILCYGNMSLCYFKKSIYCLKLPSYYNQINSKSDLEILSTKSVIVTKI